MDGHKEYLSDIIEGKKTRFVIPVYQRNYDWKPEQCGRLFDDLVEVSKTGREEHFFGSIVSQTPRGERVVIDGQQRITTVFLLFAAIRTQVEKGVVKSQEEDLAEDIAEYYLIDARHKKERKLRLKLVKNDSEAFGAILDGKDDAYIQGSNVTQNYLYFLDRIEKMDISADELYEAIKSLCVIDITLDPKDDAQLIFESLNSTGLDLSEADKIRNFVLMNLDPELQEIYYDDYWNPVERNTDYKVSDYIRFYLSAMERRPPLSRRCIRRLGRIQLRSSTIRRRSAQPRHEGLFEELLNYSKHYKTCIHPNTGVKSIDSASRPSGSSTRRSPDPTFSTCSSTEQGDIDDDSVSAVLWTIDSYLFRRWACGVPANALNKVFETLHGDVLKGVSDGADYARWSNTS